MEFTTTSAVNIETIDRQRIAGDDLGSSHLGMHGKKQRGLDYTPLFRFLLSKVGSGWNEVYSEAVARLDRPEPIFWLVALRHQDEQDYIKTGESSYFSGLRVDEAGVLRVVDPDLGPHSLLPFCKCCTHTFNGLPFTKKFDPNAHSWVVGVSCRLTIPSRGPVPASRAWPLMSNVRALQCSESSSHLSPLSLEQQPKLLQPGSLYPEQLSPLFLPSSWSQSY